MKNQIKQVVFAVVMIMITLSFSSCSKMSKGLGEYQLGQTNAKDVVYHGYINGQFLDHDMVEVHMRDVTGYVIWAYFPANLYKQAVYANRDVANDIRVYVSMRQVWSWHHMSDVFEITSTQTYPLMPVPSSCGPVCSVPTNHAVTRCSTNFVTPQFNPAPKMVTDDHHTLIQIFGSVYGDAFIGNGNTKTGNTFPGCGEQQPGECVPYQSDTACHPVKPVPTVAL